MPRYLQKRFIAFFICCLVCLIHLYRILHHLNSCLLIIFIEYSFPVFILLVYSIHTQKPILFVLTCVRYINFFLFFFFCLSVCSMLNVKCCHVQQPHINVFTKDFGRSSAIEITLVEMEDWLDAIDLIIVRPCARIAYQNAIIYWIYWKRLIVCFCCNEKSQTSFSFYLFIHLNFLWNFFFRIRFESAAVQNNLWWAIECKQSR